MPSDPSRVRTRIEGPVRSEERAHSCSESQGSRRSRDSKEQIKSNASKMSLNPKEECNMANTAVFGLYPDYSSVESSVDTLKESGFRNTDISVLFPEHVASKDRALGKGGEA